MAVNNFVNPTNVNNSSAVLADQPSEMGIRKTMSSLEIAEEVGKAHNDLLKSIRKMEVAWTNVCGGKFSQTSKLIPMPNGGFRQTDCYEFNYEEFLFVASKFDDERRARLVLRWGSIETGQAVPMYQVSTTVQPKPLPLKDQLTWVKEVSKLLKLNDASTLGMLQQIAQPLNLPIPDYTPSKGFVLCADKLLKKNAVQLSSRKFNEIMVNHGYITYREKTSRKKGIDRFPVLTDEGLKWGENQVSPKDQRKTQIQYYEDKFPQLLEELGLLPKGE